MGQYFMFVEKGRKGRLFHIVRERPTLSWRIISISDTMKKHVVVISGAGISAESGVKTFRDSGGLWEDHRVEDVATPEAWQSNPDLVLKFYNQRRKQLLEVEPNAAHNALVELERGLEVTIITQNVDNLHERAGSTNVIHLHGLLTQSRSAFDEFEIYDIPGWELKKGQLCSHGLQLRPNIVWFGEAVPMMGVASRIVDLADILIVVGTSLNVYPAASLVDLADSNIPIYLIDPGSPAVRTAPNQIHIKEKAGAALPRLVQNLLGSDQ
jgi:NAD-dependent deacetylase